MSNHTTELLMMEDLYQRFGLGSPAKVLLLSLDSNGGHEQSLRESLNSLPDTIIHLSHHSFEPSKLDKKELYRTLQASHPEVILLTLSSLSLRASNHLIPVLRKALLRVPIISVIDPEHPNDLAEIFKMDVLDFIIPPFNSLEILARIWQALSRRNDGVVSRQYLKEKFGLDQLVGEAPAFLEAISKLRLFADCDVSVMISGETGTGKELVARSIHYLSSRAAKPFVPVNCGAIPLDLIENELFGHERGAFTGASNNHEGLIQEADGGTIFLDEIDSLPLMAQVKLLRFLQSKEYRPLGSSKTITANVRTIAASNANLQDALLAGTLRKDLYYRLNVIPFELPALRERRGDIPLLAQHFICKYSAEFNKPARALSPEAMHALCVYDWPGNIRELEHVIERAVVLCNQRIIQDDLVLLAGTQQRFQGSFQELKDRVVSQFERSYIQHLLLVHRGNITRAAQAAKKERRTFWELIRKHDIDVQSFRCDQMTEEV